MTATRRLLRGVEIVLLAVGVACLAYVAAVGFEIKTYQALQERRLDEVIAARKAEVVGMYRTESREATPPEGPTGDQLGDLVGRIEIPRLGLRAAVVQGDNTAILQVAVGHIPWTPRPGEPGNAVLAGHRDTFFRPLRGVRIGDEVVMRLPEGDIVFDVTDTALVEPDAVWVMNDTASSVLTLVTCYPFDYVGPAPLRFVVRAVRRGPV